MKRRKRLIGGVETFLLNLFLLYGSVLVLLGSVITGLVMKWNLKREKLHHLAEGADDIDADSEGANSSQETG